MYLYLNKWKRFKISRKYLAKYLPTQMHNQQQTKRQNTTPFSFDTNNHQQLWPKHVKTVAFD